MTSHLRTVLAFAPIVLALACVPAGAQLCEPEHLAIHEATYARGVCVAGDDLYMADEGALAHLDVSDPRDPEVYFSLPSEIPHYDVHVSGDIALVSGGGHGLLIYQLTDPHPWLVAQVPTPDWLEEAEAHDGVAWLAVGDAGLIAVDISDPSDPRVLSQTPLRAGAWTIAIRWPLAYVGAWGVLAIVDIADPAAPVVLGEELTFGSATYAIELWDDLAFVAANHDGMAILSIADPESPALMSWIDTGRAVDLSVDGHVVYVADDSTGLDVINVADPSKPYLAGSLEWDSGTSRYVAGAEGIAYVTNGPPGLSIIDARNCSRLCAADLDSNFVLDSRDIVLFLNGWNQQLWWADWVGDFQFNSQDVIGFLDAWAGGC